MLVFVIFLSVFFQPYKNSIVYSNCKYLLKIFFCNNLFFTLLFSTNSFYYALSHNVSLFLYLFSIPYFVHFTHMKLFFLYVLQSQHSSRKSITKQHNLFRNHFTKVQQCIDYTYIYSQLKTRKAQHLHVEPSVIPEGFEPPISWAVTRGINPLCYGTFCYQTTMQKYANILNLQIF